jgi:hypothetical protein
MRTVPFSILTLTLIVSAPVVRADQITIVAGKDNTIYENSPANSAGASGAMFSGTNNTTSPRRGLVAFDVASALPAGATITNASLTLYLGISSNSTPRSIELHRVTSKWTEGTAGSGSTFNGSGNGFSPALGGATWNEGAPGFPWTAGGTFVAAASASTTVGNTIDSAYTWSSTPGLLSDVTDWYGNPASNFGWALVNSVENVNQTVKGFYTRDATETAFLPKLTLEYTVPEPSTAALLALSISAFAVRRSRAPNRF